MTPTIARFDPASHDLATFSCGVEEVDSFFNARRDAHNFRLVWEQRIGDIFVALDGGEIVGVIAYAASKIPPEALETVVDDFRLAGRKGRRKPLEQGEIPAYRVIVLGVLPRCQRRGVGSALVRHALAAVTAPVYYLFPQRGSEEFYENLGFVERPTAFRKLMMHIPPVRDIFSGE